jgi:hypothetical protein
MKNKLITLIKGAAAVVLIVTGSGCSMVLNPTSPISVATAFWSEALSEDNSGAAQYMKRKGKLSLGFQGYSDDDEAFLSKVNQSGGIYYIDTNIQILRNGAYVTIPLKTVMVPVDGVWKVDFWSTKASMDDAAFDNAVNYITTSQSSYNILFKEKPKTGNKILAVKSAEQRLDKSFEDAKEVLMKAVRKSYGVPEPKPKDKK